MMVCEIQFLSLRFRLKALIGFIGPFLGLLHDSTALADTRDFKTLGINLMARQYSMDSATVDQVDSSPMLEYELDLRLYKVYHFALIGLQSNDGNRKGYGAGARINLPGYFLIGAKPAELTREAKLYPVNTSIYGFAVRNSLTKTDGTKEDTMLAQYGGTVDVFLFNRFLYLTLDVGLHTLKGDSSWIYGGGLGFQF